MCVCYAILNLELVGVRFERLHEVLDVELRSDKDRTALMNGCGRQVENALGAVCGQSAGLLDHIRHRIALVEQTKLAVASVLCRRVHENTTVEQRSVHVGNH